MKYKNGLVGWDRFDEDRWILATVTSLVFLVATFFLLQTIKIPKYPEKPPIIEEIDFIDEEVIKKTVEVTPDPTPVINEPEEVFQEDPEIVIENIFTQDNENVAVPQDLPFSTELNIFENENQEIEQAVEITQITDGIMLDESPTDQLNVTEGFDSEFEQDNIENTVITEKISDERITESSGLSSTIQMPTENLSNDFRGFTGNIDWTEMIDPIFKWMETNSGPIGKIPFFTLAKNDKNSCTVRKNIAIDGKKYELYLAGRSDRNQLTICLVNLETSEFVKLEDPGLKGKATQYNFGIVRRDEVTNEIINFSKGTYRNANDPKAQEYIKIFWQWAKKVAG